MERIQRKFDNKISGILLIAKTTMKNLSEFVIKISELQFYIMQETN